ncbi:MAG: hypothetical protein KDA80_13735 [Planctomycetaceae bacterium]|nr:hypothetical protein [Planctomycetaceae bacterium]
MLDREEYIEQSYFFRVLRERIEDNTPIQEVLIGIKEEILATTKLPMAISFLVDELSHRGKVGPAMQRLSHYFAPFQTFIMTRAEDEESRLDFRIALKILEREAEFRSSGDSQPAALFIFQFECLSRNQLGYDHGMAAVAVDPHYPRDWSEWISRIRFQLGTVDFSELIYLRSAAHLKEVRSRRNEPDYQPSYPILFDEQAGRIARANMGKDPLYMFAALQRQLGYPTVPRPHRKPEATAFSPQLEQRFQRLESRVALLEQEAKGGIDLSEFYKSQPKD